MIPDVVIDTNVFRHSADERQGALGEAAKRFLELLQMCETQLCVDPGFDPDPARNRSYIAHEYYQHINFVHPAFAVIVLLGRAGRIIQVSRSVGQQAHKLIRQLVYDETDRIFVRVTFNTRSKTLVSHDFHHLPGQCRTTLLRRLGIIVTDAPAGCDSLRPDG
jgi:5-carboxymethyl-2-hydroxymuconate isomerase